MLRDRLWPLVRATRLPDVLAWVLEKEAQARCERQVAAEAGARFGPKAVVHNPTNDRGLISLGANTYVDGELLVHPYGGRIEIGSHSYVGMGTRVWSGEHVRIGSDVFIAHNVNIADTNAHQLSARERAEHYRRTVIGGAPFEKGSIKTAPVVIGDHAWLNFNVAVLKGVTIGEGAIIGACSLVTEDVPPYVLCAGNPARILRDLDAEELGAARAGRGT